jgi:cysteine desulfurase
MKSPKGYFDYNATTPMSAGVIEQVRKSFALYANPSSMSGQGQECKKKIEWARKNVSDLIGATPEELIFTSGGSESNNLAIKSKLLKHKRKPGHIIASAIEHASVLSAIDCYAEEFGFSVTKVTPDNKGIVKAEAILRAVKPDTQLITIMMANNELGSIQPIQEIGDIAHARDIHFHVDAVQAVGKVPVDVGRIKINSLSLSAHKFYGPKGIGALYVRNLIIGQPLIHGGGQEKGLRGGTENVLGIVGLGQAALEAEASLSTWQAHFRKLRRSFVQRLFETIPTAELNSPDKESDCVPNTLNVYLPDIRADALAALLEHKYGYIVSTGSACSNNKIKKLSHVLTAIGFSESRVKASFRISFGQYTDEEDIAGLVDAIHQAYQTLLNIAP